MESVLRMLVLCAACLSLPVSAYAQESAEQPPAEEAIQETAQQVVSDTREKVQDIAGRVDQMEEAKEVSAGLLQPIYVLAETLAFPAFHWLAFTLMAAGVVSFALQLVLGKLVLLSKMSFNLKEILSDVVGLVISLIGLVLTTQAAAENSTFTESPAAVLSAAVVGVLVGLVLYRWGQSQEVQAALGRTQQSKQPKPT